MKNNSPDSTLFEKDNNSNNSPTTNINKTTNVNILLNRVRLDEKRNFKKKIFFFSLLVLITSTIVILAIN